MDKLISLYIGDRACEGGLNYHYLEVYFLFLYFFIIFRVNKYIKKVTL